MELHAWGCGLGMKLTILLYLLPRLGMSGVMIPLSHTHSWRAERLPYIGCARRDVLTDFWDVMMLLFRLAHYFRNILKMEADSTSEIFEPVYAASDPRGLDSFYSR